MDKKNISKKVKDWKLLEFVAPITESFLEDDDFLIRGIAINETTTLNNIKYVAEELEKAAPSFRDVPILLDHENVVKNIVGRTTENVNFNRNDKRIDFEAKIRDKDIQEMIKDGRLKSVSIGARVEDLTEEEDGSMKALGVQGMEISFVACAGDQGATFGQALHQSFILKEMANKVDNKASDINQLNKMENKQMAEEEKTDAVEAEVEATEEKPEAEAPAEETVKEPAEDKEEVATEKAKSGIISEMRKEITEMRQLLVEKRKLREEIEAEPEVETPAAEEPAADKPKEEVTDETKGDVSDAPEEAEETSEGFVVERAGAGKFAVYRDYAKESQDSKLKRLIR